MGKGRRDGAQEEGRWVLRQGKERERAYPHSKLRESTGNHCMYLAKFGVATLGFLKEWPHNVYLHGAQVQHFDRYGLVQHAESINQLVEASFADVFEQRSDLRTRVQDVYHNYKVSLSFLPLTAD